jgi:hypothetical protein
MNENWNDRKPFGEECCENELGVYQNRYEDYFFDHAPFLNEAIDRKTYLIVGRRGSGKTSLSNFFRFQNKVKNKIKNKIKNAKTIIVDEAWQYYETIGEVSLELPHTDEVAIPRMEKLWEYLIWGLIFSEYKNFDPVIKSASFLSGGNEKPSIFIKNLLLQVLERIGGKGTGKIFEEAEAHIKTPVFEKAKIAVLEICKKNPLILSLDTLERYDITNEALMRCTTALIQNASNFNSLYSSLGLHIKVFVSAEVFPHLQERHITNSLKFIREELYLHWRPKDLERLLAWRFYKYLLEEKIVTENFGKDVDWESSNEVHKLMWEPYWGNTIKNGLGIEEHTFPYLLRHTQLRPRQIIFLCNKIADSSRGKTFPKFQNNIVVRDVLQAETKLATEVINSYDKLYANVGKILDALNGVDIIFEGKELDKRAPKTASAWPKDKYSPDQFKQLVAELGIVGRVRPNTKGKIIEADFEYTMEGRLVLPHDAELVLHPMFIKKFNAKVNQEIVIYPFPDHPEFEEIK